VYTYQTALDCSMIWSVTLHYTSLQQATLSPNPHLPFALNITLNATITYKLISVTQPTYVHYFVIINHHDHFIQLIRIC